MMKHGINKDLKIFLRFLGKVRPLVPKNSLRPNSEILRNAGAQRTVSYCYKIVQFRSYCCYAGSFGNRSDASTLPQSPFLNKLW